MIPRSFVCLSLILSSVLMSGYNSIAACDIFILPAAPFNFLDTEDTSYRFKSCTVARVKSVTLINEATPDGALPDVVYELEVIRTVIGPKHKGIMLLYGSHGYATSGSIYEFGGGRLEFQGGYAPGELVALPLVPDPNMTDIQDLFFRNSTAPRGKHFRIEPAPLLPDLFPRDVNWSREFMAGLVRYIELREQAGKLKEDRASFWLKHLVPTEPAYVRMQAIWWLGRLQYKPAIPRIVLALTEGGDRHGARMRRVVYEALREFAPADYAERLTLTATHSDAAVRRTAISLLTLLVDKPEARSFCEQHMKDADPGIRIIALRKAALYGLSEFVESAKQDRSPEVRKKARDILSKGKLHK